MGTSLALAAGVRIEILSLLVVTATACSPAQRAVVGGGMAAAGGGLTFLAVESMAGSCQQPRAPDGVCNASSNKPTPPRTALPVAFAGLGIAFLGAVVMATADEHGGASSSVAPGAPPPPDAPAPPGNPVPLTEDEAVGMAVAHLVLTDIDGNSRPAKLLGVDDSQSSLQVEKQYAELSKLRIRVAADGTWRAVGACYEYESEWRLTSFRTTPGCPR